MADKVSIPVIVFGALGIGSLVYALTRKPRYLYDGSVQLCEADPPEYGIEKDCTALFLTRGAGSGTIIAPFDGLVNLSTTISGAPTMIIRSSSEPVGFSFKMEGTSDLLGGAVKFKAGDVIGIAERVKVSAFRDEDNTQKPMAPSTFLASKGLYPASQVGNRWCENRNELIVPHCDGVTFRPPSLPKVSLRSVKISLT